VIGKSLLLGFVRGGVLEETTVVVSERLHGAE
jgi:hypothetical protein